MKRFAHSSTLALRATRHQYSARLIDEKTSPFAFVKMLAE